MPVINHQRFSRPQRRPHKLAKRLFLTTALLASIFIAANVVMAIVYRSKVLPNVYLGSAKVSGMSYESLAKLPVSTGIERSVQLKQGGVSKTLAVYDLGFSTDISASSKQIRGHWSRWLPIVSLVRRTTVPAVLRVDRARLRAVVADVSPSFERSAQDIHVAFNGQRFARAAASDGVAVEKTATQQSLQKAIAAGSPTAQVTTYVVKPVVHNTDLTSAIGALNQQLSTTVSFAKYGGPKVQPTIAQKAAWYAQDGQSLSLSDLQIGAYLDQVAAQQSVALINREDLITAARFSLTHQQPLDFRLAAQGSSLRTYCTAARGVNEAGLDELVGKLAAVYADVRGWNDEGSIGFRHDAAGCQYTVWLAAPALMSTFGAVCDDYYNCQAGSSVVVNSDRWNGATPAWNSTGGTLENYRNLIINHETGHRLGFLDNPVCPAAGGPAPVMMQQSIDLHGCAFNIWPTAAELSQLKTML